MGPARSIRARITSDFGTLLRFAHRARRSARFLSSLTVMVGTVIPRYYHACLMSVPGLERPRLDAMASVVTPGLRPSRAPRIAVNFNSIEHSNVVAVDELGRGLEPSIAPSTGRLQYFVTLRYRGGPEHRSASRCENEVKTL